MMIDYKKTFISPTLGNCIDYLKIVEHNSSLMETWCLNVVLYILK